MQLIKTIIFSLILILIPYRLIAQKATYLDKIIYINKYKQIAVEQMQQYAIPASITLAQGILETSAGLSELAIEANNHFGIKCKREWSGNTYTYTDDEENECFRAYNSVQESFYDHSLFLQSRKWYENLFKLKYNDYKNWAIGLKKAGYATDKYYTKKLLEIIQEFNLAQFDLPTLISVKKIVPPSYNASSPYYRFIQEHFVYYKNGIPFIVTNKKDTYYRISKSYNVSIEQLFKYNDLKDNNVLKTGDIVYLKAKENKALEEYHIVKENETPYSIAQHHGIKLFLLCKRNHITNNENLSVGSIINLNKEFKRGFNVASAIYKLSILNEQ